MKHKGFYNLKTPEDLLKKAKRGFDKFQNEKLNIDLAFNLFVTLEHMPDWLGMTKQERKLIISSSPVLRVCSHLASGIKHFNPYDSYTSVKSTQEDSVYEDGVYEDSIYDKWLTISLDGDEINEFGQQEIETIELGKRIIKFWEDYMNENRTNIDSH